MTSIKTDRTRQTLSAFGGLVTLQRAVDLSKLESDLADALPKGLRVARKASSFEKFMALFATSCCGAECIDDVEVMQNDPGIASFLSGKMVSAQAYGDFLRDFSGENIRKLNLALRDHSRKLSAAAHPNQKEIIVSLDSTSHVQHGLQMEGVEYNYKNELALDSLQAYDQFGFPLYFELRPGNIHTATNASSAIHHCFHGLHRKVKKMLLADAGYANQDVYNACHAAGAKFIITANRASIDANAHRITNWKTTKKIQTHDGRDVEVGSVLYQTRDHNEPMRLVVMRARKPEAQRFLGLYDDYDFFGWVTNTGRHELTEEKVILKYRKRANVENFIRETKNNFDLHHFPCQKLTANAAYGLITMFAHAHMRLLSRVAHPTRNHFAKTLRNLILVKPVQVVKHGRQIVFRFMEHQLEEVYIWINRLHIVLRGSS